MARDDGGSPMLGPLPTLPVFFKLRGRRVVLAGGGVPAVWKAEVLCAAGARVEVFAEAPCAGLEALALSLGEAALRLVRRAWQASDLPGAAIALGAIEELDEAEAFRAAAAAAGVPVNVVDKPALCDFQFGTLVERSPLVLAITTDGAAPVFGQAVRARIEALLPPGLRGWAGAAQAWRPAVQARNWPFRQRRHFWERFADRAMRFAERVPDAADLEACFAAAESSAASRTGGVTMVGCGPGTLDDVTFGAMRALQTADVILVDDDVDAEIVNLARREATKERSAGESDAERLAASVAAGAQAVWLGTGNATSCARWHVRADRLARFDVQPAHVVGVSRCPLCGDACPRDPSGRWTTAQAR